MMCALFKLLCSLALISCVHAQTTCINLTDCSYNGVCNSITHRCDCFPQWKDNHCATLHLIPGAKDFGLHSFTNNSQTSSWGGSVVHDGDNYHMIASEMTNNCGINTWLSNSQIIHATSANAIGQYQRSSFNPVWGLFSHEPKVIKALDTNEYVIYFTNAYPPITKTWPCLNCNNGSTNPRGCDNAVDVDNNGGSLPLILTKMIFTSNISDGDAWSDTLEINTPTPWLDSNLDCYIFKNGSVICLGRSATNGSDYSGYFIEKASNWKDNRTYTYVNITENISKIKGMHCCGEDPFIWFDERFGGDGVLHAIWHYNNESDWSFPGGIHTFSVDGGYHWNTFLEFDKYEPEYAYGSYVEYGDGTSQNLTRCERPKLIISDDGYTPLALTNGAQPAKTNDFTFTLLRPINQT